METLDAPWSPPCKGDPGRALEPPMSRRPRTRSGVPHVKETPDALWSPPCQGDPPQALEFPPFVLRLSKYERGERGAEVNRKTRDTQQGSSVAKQNMGNKALIPRKKRSPNLSHEFALREIEKPTSGLHGVPHVKETPDAP